MSIPSEVKNLNAKCADTAYFFYLGCQKKCKCGKMKGALVSREIYIYVFPTIQRWISYMYTNMNHVFVALHSFLGAGIPTCEPRMWHQRKWRLQVLPYSFQNLFEWLVGRDLCCLSLLYSVLLSVVLSVYLLYSSFSKRETKTAEHQNTITLLAKFHILRCPKHF